MEVTASLEASYPTVTYHKAVLFASVKLTDADLPAEVSQLPLQQKAQWMNNAATCILQQNFAEEHSQIEKNMAARYLTRVLPTELESQLIREGKLKL